jgi:undecaprenyl-diphosphatase
MTNVEAIVIAFVEGITEFLPISSTGHMVIASSFMGIQEEAFTKLFEVVIQLGAILSVVLLYWKKFFNFNRIGFYVKLLIAVIPALIFGGLLKKHIDQVLENPLFIAVVMLVGGIVLLFVDRWFKQPDIKDEENISNRKALIIGSFQVLAVIFPGLSRSAATIIGGMQQKLTRPLAAEFSFFLAVPTMMAATVKSIYDIWKEEPEILNSAGIQTLAIGSSVAFIVALLAIRFLLKFLQHNGFRVFGWYRIALGSILIILISLKLV